MDNIGKNINQLTDAAIKQRKYKYVDQEAFRSDMQSATNIAKTNTEIRAAHQLYNDKLLEDFRSGKINTETYAHYAKFNGGLSTKEININIHSVNAEALYAQQDLNNNRIKKEDLSKTQTTRARRKSTEGMTQLTKDGRIKKVGIYEHPSGPIGGTYGEELILFTQEPSACPINAKLAGECRIIEDDAQFGSMLKVYNAEKVPKANKKSSSTEFKLGSIIHSKVEPASYTMLEFEEMDFELKLQALKYFLFEINDFQLYAEVCLHLDTNPYFFKKLVKDVFEKNKNFLNDFIKNNPSIVQDFVKSNPSFSKTADFQKVSYFQEINASSTSEENLSFNFAENGWFLSVLLILIFALAFIPKIFK